MGCTGSKQAISERTIAPLKRSSSLPEMVNRRRSDIDACHVAGRQSADHVVALKSSTLGSLDLHPSDERGATIISSSISKKNNDNNQDKNAGRTEETAAAEAEDRGGARKVSADALLRSKLWSNETDGKISQPIPKTPSQTPPNEPEAIDAWELMDGLEDSSLLHSISNDVVAAAADPKFKAEEAEIKHESIWNPLPILTDFDPEILSHFRKALDELSPSPIACRSRSRSPAPEDSGSARFPRVEGIGHQRCFSAEKFPARCIEEERVVLYFTSLRGVRKTYEDCCNVRLILKGYGIKVDEKDVSMHQAFRDQLQQEMSATGGWKREDNQRFRLPRVFVRGRLLGGAEEVRRLHESGELGKLLRGCEEDEAAPDPCDTCGDVRFVPCSRCFGSCKIFDEDDDMFLRCPDCNENGIILCPICCT